MVKIACPCPLRGNCTSPRNRAAGMEEQPYSTSNCVLRWNHTEGNIHLALKSPLPGSQDGVGQGYEGQRRSYGRTEETGRSLPGWGCRGRGGYFVINNFLAGSFDVLMLIGQALALIFNYASMREEGGRGETVTRRYLEVNTAFFVTAGWRSCSCTTGCPCWPWSRTWPWDRTD